MIKEEMAQKLLKIARTLPNDRKQDMIIAFTKKNQHRPDFQDHLEQFKKAINYKQ